MARYVRLGAVPRKRHTQFRKPDGGLYTEQVFGTRGFSGIESILYHIHAPTRTLEYTSLPVQAVKTESDPPLHHRHLKTLAVKACGDPITGRTVLLTNEDVAIGVCRPVEGMDYFYKNADGDDLLFIHEGTGRIETLFGPLDYGAGDYVIIPRGAIYRIIAAASDPQRHLVISSAASPIEPPKRYRNEYGQLLEHAPYCERDIRVPETLETHDEAGEFTVHIKSRGRMTAYHYDYHPFDVIGWDGYLYPWALNIGDFEPITGSLHMPPPTHQTFEARNFVVCSFVPRMLDYHPDSVPIPYNHSNLDSDELMYYVNGNYAARRGIELGSMTLHPSGIPHGPQPGAVEASLGSKRTEELVVMLDTFRPLNLTQAAVALEDDQYALSWKPAMP